MDNTVLKEIVDRVKERLAEKERLQRLIPIEASARHVHLSVKDVEDLFGKGHRLTFKRELSQPGQFLSEERVTIIGPKGILNKVAVLGPEREKTQVEISRTDAVTLGIDPPIRESGDTENSAIIFIASSKAMIQIKEGAIVAKRHIHMPPDLATDFGLKDKQIVAVRVLSDRPVIFEDVLVRVNKNYRLNMHIDFDEANACNLREGIKGQILTDEEKSP